MAMFSTRNLDRMLDTIAPVIGNSEVKWLRRRLRKGGNHGIGAEWEIAILYGLSRVGIITAIPERAGASRLDILFAPHADPAAVVQVEVTAISDADRDDRLVRNTPVERRLRKKGDQSNGTSLEYPVIVVLADNDCFALRRSPHTRVPPAEDIVDLILAGRREWREGLWLMQSEVAPAAPVVSGVLLLAVRDLLTSGGLGVRLTPTYVGNRLLPPVSTSVISALEQALHHLPPLRQSPMRARARATDRFSDHYGGGFVRAGKTRTQFYLSLGGVRAVMSDELPFDRFIHDHRDIARWICLAVEQGRYLTAAHVEICSDVDDDWLVLEFTVDEGTAPTTVIDSPTIAKN
ncbi:MAG: hypothetical protein ACRDUX_35585 [Mycobacterium sp.]